MKNKSKIVLPAILLTSSLIAPYWLLQGRNASATLEGHCSLPILEYTLTEENPAFSEIQTFEQKMINAAVFWHKYQAESCNLLGQQMSRLDLLGTDIVQLIENGSYTIGYVTLFTSNNDLVTVPVSEVDIEEVKRQYGSGGLRSRTTAFPIDIPSEVYQSIMNK
jgi:hypothetical protein